MNTQVLRSTEAGGGGRRSWHPTNQGILGLDHGIGHLASMRPQKNERLNPNRG